MTNAGASRYPFPGSARALACRFRRLAEMVLLSNQECRWRGANDSTRGRVRSPDLNRNAYDLLADSRSKTSLNRISGEDLRWAHRAEPSVPALPLDEFFLWRQPCRLHPFIAGDTPASTGQTKATARRESDAATALNRRAIIFA